MLTAAALSLLVHAFLLALHFGGATLGVPTFGAQLAVRLAPAPLPGPPSRASSPTPSAEVLARGDAPQLRAREPANAAASAGAGEVQQRVSAPNAGEQQAPRVRVIAQDPVDHAGFAVPLPVPVEAIERTLDVGAVQEGADHQGETSLAQDGAPAVSRSLAPRAAIIDPASATAMLAISEDRQQELAEQGLAELERVAAQRQLREQEDQARELERLAMEEAQRRERERLAMEEVQRRERERLAMEEAQQRERERLAMEEAQLRERERLAMEEAQLRERERLAMAEAQRRERERLAMEEAQRRERERLAMEEAQQRERERLAVEEAQRRERERLAMEEAQLRERERLAMEEAQRRERERLAVEEAQRRERERLAVEEAQRRERERLALEQQQAAAGPVRPAASEPRASVAGGGPAGSIVLPRSMLASEAGLRAREAVRGLGVLDSPPRALVEREAMRRRAVVAQAEKDVPLRMYVEGWRQKIERNASLYVADGRSGRVEMVVVVSIRSDGSVEDVAVVRTSGRATLDAAVRNLVRINARYAAFPSTISDRYDVIEIRRVWVFDGRLQLVEELD